jgi:hypothetical protein
VAASGRAVAPAVATIDNHEAQQRSGTDNTGCTVAPTFEGAESNGEHPAETTGHWLFDQAEDRVLADVLGARPIEDERTDFATEPIDYCVLCGSDYGPDGTCAHCDGRKSA